MSRNDLPNDSSALSPWGYWQESLQTWAEFSQRTTKIMMSQIGGPLAGKGKLPGADADSLTNELLRSLSDMNLQHWQNTARLLESLPAWMQAPHNMTGSVLVDWFDTIQRNYTEIDIALEPKPMPAAPELSRPITLAAPNGQADDLTKIKGIGRKLSARLSALGIFHFKQIADWSEPEVRWIETQLASRGRVMREAWIKQAAALSATGSASIQ